MIKQPQNVVVIGSGIAGSGTAWLLAQAGHKVTIIEKNEVLGGHTCTQTVTMGKQTHSVDMGFIVFNRPNYPFLSGFFDYLAIKTQKTEMSFAVSRKGGKHQYGGRNFANFMAHKPSRWRLSHWKLLFEVLRFNKSALAWLLNDGRDEQQTLGEWLENNRFSAHLADAYLLPMSAAIWSCPPTKMLQYPANSLLSFFKNHGLLQLKNRPQWETVTGGSQIYLHKLLSHPNITCVKGVTVSHIQRDDSSVSVHLLSGETHTADQLVMASHANQSLALLADGATEEERKLLSPFAYQENHAYLHSDLTLMPSEKNVWSAWNFIEASTDEPVQVSYWMNCLQSINSEQPLIVTLNPNTPPSPEKTWQYKRFEHPVFTMQTKAAQAQLHQIQGKQRTWFAGSYFAHGFHEDGFASAVSVAAAWGIAAPWLIK